MRQLLLTLGVAVGLVVYGQKSTPQTAEHHDWEDNHVLQINREPARA